MCFESAGKRIISLTVDGEFLYWIMKAKDDTTQIYQAKKRNGAILSQVKASGSKHILAYSSALQPFPGNRVVHTTCLLPSKAVYPSSLCMRPSLPLHILSDLPAVYPDSQMHTAWTAVGTIRHGSL